MIEIRFHDCPAYLRVKLWEAQFDVYIFFDLSQIRIIDCFLELFICSISSVACNIESLIHIKSEFFI